MNKICLILLLGVILPILTVSKIFAQNFPPNDFNGAVNLSTAKHPVAVAAGDLNGDAKPDLVVANQGAATLSIYRNKRVQYSISDTTFATKADLSLTALSMPENVLLEDMDKDGKPDIVVTYFNDKMVSFFRNITAAGNASPAFAAKVDFNIGLYAHNVCLGDIDGDNKPDLVVINYDAGTVLLFRNTTASPGAAISVLQSAEIFTGGHPSSVSLGNLDGDSHPDMAVVVDDQGMVLVFRNLITTSGSISLNSFGPRIEVLAGNNPYTIKIADLNNDGKAELIFSNIDGKHMLSVCQNTTSTAGVISFAAKVDFATGNHPYGFDIKDLDGDGRLDLFVANWYNVGLVSVLKNNWTSGALQPLSFAGKIDLRTGNNPLMLIMADLDGDNKPEIITANSYDSSVSLIKYFPSGSLRPAFAESTASASLSSFVSSNIYDNEWKQQAPHIGGYSIADDDGTTINASQSNLDLKGRYAYFYVMGSRNPLSYVTSNISFTAKGTGNVEVRILSTHDLSLQASKSFSLTSTFTDYNWSYEWLWPQVEYVVCVVFRPVSGAASYGQFKKNFSLDLKQGGLTGDYTRFRADSTSLIGNTERDWYGWRDVGTSGYVQKKYLQHSAYSRMRFQTSATKILIEYVRDFYDRPVLNLFPYAVTEYKSYFMPNGSVAVAANNDPIEKMNGINRATRVQGNKTYTIWGLQTTNPTYVFFGANGLPLAPADSLPPDPTSTPSAKVYRVVSPPNAARLGLLVQNAAAGDNYLVFTNTMIVEGSSAQIPPYTTPFQLFAGYQSSRISGPAVFINGSLYKYYSTEQTDVAKQIQFVADDLPAGNKTVEIMMTGQGTYDNADPHVRRSGNYLRAVYFPGRPNDHVKVTPAQTDTNSVAFIHDSIISGFNISSNAQNNVWMMKIMRDPAYGFKNAVGLNAEVYSEGYGGRILNTDTKTAVLRDTLAKKLSRLKANKYWFQVGVNDYGFKTRLDSFYYGYKALIESLHSLKPSAKMYIQTIGPASYDLNNGETYADDGISPTGPTANDFAAIQRAIANSHSYCELVDFRTLFDGKSIDLLGDGTHPTDAGNLAYANGIKMKSKLLGTNFAAVPLAIRSQPLRKFIRTVPSGITAVTAQGGIPPYTFSLQTGSTMPGGLTLNADGTITGTPNTAGTFVRTFVVKDLTNATATRSDTIRIDSVPVIKIGPVKLMNSRQHYSYNAILNGNFGYGPYKFAVTAGSLPAGLTLNQTTGTLSGTPTTLTSGPVSFNVTATDRWNFSGTKTFTMEVQSSAPTLPTSALTFNGKLENGHLFLKAQLPEAYFTVFMMHIGGYVEQFNNPQPVGNPDGINIQIPAGSLSTGWIDMGTYQTQFTVTRIIVYISSTFPNPLNGVNITYPAPLYYINPPFN